MILRHSFEPVDNTRLAHLCGALDEHLRTIEIGLDVRISRREAQFSVEGERDAAERAIAEATDLSLMDLDEAAF